MSFLLLRLLSSGEVRFQALVVATDSQDDFPVPDGSTRQYLAEYGVFPVFLVNRDLKIHTTTTAQLYPFHSPSKKRRKSFHLSPKKHVEEQALQIYR